MEPKQSRRVRGRPKAWADKTEQNTIKSLDRAMGVLDHLSTLPGATLSELADELGQSAATVYRILVTLNGRGLVEFDAETQMWHVGPQAFLIGARYLRRTSVVDRARPILRRLMEDTGETANLAVSKNNAVVFVSQAECHNSIRAFFPPGTVSPMHASGIGKALLAEMSDARLTEWHKSQDLEVFTEHTLDTLDALKENLVLTKQRGFAIDDQERNLGMRCIAASVFDWRDVAVAGISVSGPVSRIKNSSIPKISEAVRNSAAALSAALGADDI